MSNYNSSSTRSCPKTRTKTPRSKSPSTLLKNPDSTIFKHAWNLLHNVCDGLTQPVTLVRPKLSSLDVGKLDSIRNLLSESSDSRQTTPADGDGPADNIGSLDGESSVDGDSPEDGDGPGGEIWASSHASTEAIKPPPPKRESRTSSPFVRRGDALGIPEKKSSNGINCILDIDQNTELRRGTHRSNQAEMSAYEYQQLLTDVQSRPNSSQQASKFLDFTYVRPGSYMQGLRTSNTSIAQSRNESHFPSRMVSKDYLSTINDQLSRINHERRQRENMLSHSQPQMPQQGFHGSGEQSQSNFGQSNNVNISLTLALGQVQQNGQLNPVSPIQVQCNAIDKPHNVIVDARVQKQKIETSMQTEIENMDLNENQEFLQIEQNLESTFPSRIPSGKWKTRRPKSAPKPVTVKPNSGWADFLNVPDVLSYTGESIKALLNLADQVVSTFIIPPDDNPFTQDEMNAAEDKIGISLLRLFGIPQQLRHQIYQEALQDLQTIQDISSGTLDVLNCVIDWILNGDSGGREEIINKVRILATITSEVDPESEVWSQFERDISIFSIAVTEVVNEGYEQAKETTRKCSEILLTTIKSSLSNVGVSPVPSTSSRDNSSIACTESTRMPTITEEEIVQSISEAGAKIDEVENEKSASFQVAHSSASLVVHNRNRQIVDKAVRSTCSNAESEFIDLNHNEVYHVSVIEPEGTPPAEEDSLLDNTNIDDGTETPKPPAYPDFDNIPSFDEGNRDKRNQNVRCEYKNDQKDKILRECRRFAKMTTHTVHAPPVNSSQEIDINHSLGYESSDEFIPGSSLHRRQNDAFLEEIDPSMYDFGIAGALANAAVSITSTLRCQAQSISSYFKRQTKQKSETNPTSQPSLAQVQEQEYSKPKDNRLSKSEKETSNPSPTASKDNEPQQLEALNETPFRQTQLLQKNSEVTGVESSQTPVKPNLSTSTDSQLPQKLLRAVEAAAALMTDQNNNETTVPKASSETPMPHVQFSLYRQRVASDIVQKEKHNKNKNSPILEQLGLATQFFEPLNEIEVPTSGVYVNEGGMTLEGTKATQLRFGLNSQSAPLQASGLDPTESLEFEAGILEEEEPSGIRTPVKPSTASKAVQSSGDIPISEQASELTQILDRMQPFWPQEHTCIDRPAVTSSWKHHKMIAEALKDQQAQRASRFLPDESLPMIQESEVIMAIQIETDPGPIRDDSKLETDLHQLEKIVNDLCGEVAAGSPSGICTPPRPSVNLCESRQSSLMDVEYRPGHAPSRIPRRAFSKSTEQYIINPNNASTIALYVPNRTSYMHTSSITIGGSSVDNNYLPMTSKNRMSSQSHRVLPQKRPPLPAKSCVKKPSIIEVVNITPLITSGFTRPGLACTRAPSITSVRANSKGLIISAASKTSYSQILQQKKEYVTRSVVHPTYNLPVRTYLGGKKNPSNVRPARSLPPKKTETGPFLVLQEKNVKPKPRAYNVGQPCIGSYRDHHGSQKQTKPQPENLKF